MRGTQNKSKKILYTSKWTPLPILPDYYENVFERPSNVKYLGGKHITYCIVRVYPITTLFSSCQRLDKSIGLFGFNAEKNIFENSNKFVSLLSYQ